MELVCYLIDDRTVDIRPARNRRHWMNQTPGSYAYRCLPLSVANAHGWEVCCPVSCEAEWNGGMNTADIHVAIEEDEGRSDKDKFARVESHFGNGILTFNVGVIIRTPPGYDLWVTGPANEFKDGIQALSAVVETYWIPFTFTMNWKFTRPNAKVRFEKGEPFCLFFPIEHGLVERFNPTLAQVSDDTSIEKEYKIALAQREILPALKVLKGEELRTNDKDWFEGWYMRGEMPRGTEIEDHKKRVQVRPFTMRRESESR